MEVREVRDGSEMEGGGCTPQRSLCDNFLWGLDLWVITGMSGFRTLYNAASVYSGSDPARRLASSSCFGWKKRLHSHTQLVRPQQVN